MDHSDNNESDSATDSASEGEHDKEPKSKLLDDKIRESGNENIGINQLNQRRNIIRKRRYKLLKSAENTKSCIYENFDVSSVPITPIFSSLTLAEDKEPILIRTQEEYDIEMLKVAQEFNASDQTVIGQVKGVYDIPVPAEIEIHEVRTQFINTIYNTYTCIYVCVLSLYHISKLILIVYNIN